MQTKRPTLKQKKLIKSMRLNPQNWLITADKPNAIVIQHRHGMQMREIAKGGQA